MAKVKKKAPLPPEGETEYGKIRARAMDQEGDRVEVCDATVACGCYKSREQHKYIKP